MKNKCTGCLTHENHLHKNYPLPVVCFDIIHNEEKENNCPCAICIIKNVCYCLCKDKKDHLTTETGTLWP
jgi:hypothetical protein